MDKYVKNKFKENPQPAKARDSHYLSAINFKELFVQSKVFNPLSANPEKWSNTLKQIVGNLPTICLSVFDHFMNLTLKGLMHIN